MATKENKYTFLSSDGLTQISVKEWVPEKVSGVIQIAHGMAEHKERYQDFAEYFCNAGYAVVANDHLGHGESIAEKDCLGFFADEDGWMKVVDDVETLRKLSREKFGDVPYYFFAHSMGTFVVRTHLIKYPEADLAGAVICGTGQNSDMILKIGKSIAKGEIKKHGKKFPSEKLDNMAFGSYLKKIPDPRTKFDWLSVDTENVDKYVADPLCGFTVTTGFFYDMMNGLEYIKVPANLAKMNHTLPVFFIAGDCDPVGDFGKQVVKVADMFRKSGSDDVTVKLYKGYRHEIFNEKDIQGTVLKDILEWIEAKKG